MEEVDQVTIRPLIVGLENRKAETLILSIAKSGAGLEGRNMSGSRPCWIAERVQDSGLNLKVSRASWSREKILFATPTTRSGPSTPTSGARAPRGGRNQKVKYPIVNTQACRLKVESPVA